jgi:hypothetical protein
MACCGQGRAALRQAVRSPAAATPPVQAGSGERRVLVQYRCASHVVVRGVASGRLYEFDADRQRVYVAEADAAVLLRSRHFMRAD